MIETNKNKRIRTENGWRNKSIFICLLLMVAAVPVSRAALSVSIIIFLGVTLLNKSILHQLKICFSTPLLISFSGLFFIPFFSGLWSHDAGQWLNVIRIKLPLLLFPVAFAGEWKLSEKQWFYVALSFIIMVCGGCVWGLTDYLQNMQAVHAGYLKAKTILTPLQNDHVRFSWMAAIAFMICILLLLKVGKTAKLFAGLMALFFVIYLHVLSARTGLVSVYIFLLLFVAYYLLASTNSKKLWLFLLLIFLLPVIAYFSLPTLRARAQYILYDISFVQKGEYLPGSNDGARVMSLKAGWQVLKKAPLGVGAGDVMHEADKWYAANVPQVLATDKFYPSSEWLMYGCFAGWIGVAGFTAIMLLPFLYKVNRHKIFWIALNAMAAFSFVFDMGLEVQYGVFIYAATFFCWWKWATASYKREEV